MNDYRVNLDIYNGPLDLLLYLIRRDELDIYDIPIARITEQYVQYVTMLQQLDPNLAGEFLVLLASLMEIKTRMLLPTPPPEEAAADGVGIDPRAELVRQLLQYKAFKDAAGDLAQAATEQSQRFARRPGEMPQGDPHEVDLEDVQLWDLLDAFTRLMEAIGRQPTHHEVIYDDTPVELHAADIVDRLGREGPMSFERVFEGRTGRGEIVGLFLALLELIRQRRIHARQDDNFAQIWLELRAAQESAAPPAPPAGQSAPAGGADAGAATAADAATGQTQGADAGPQDRDLPVQEGQYIGSDPIDRGDDDDDSGTEAAGTGY